MKEYQIAIEKEIAQFAAEHESDYKLIIEKILSYNYKNYTNDFNEFFKFRKELKSYYLKRAIADFKTSKDKNLKELIVNLADVSYDRDYDVLIGLEEEDIFQKVLAYANDFLKGEDFIFFQQQYVNSEVLFALVSAYENSLFSKEILLFFETAFDYVKKYASENDTKKTSTSKDPDGSTLLELAKALSSFDVKSREHFTSTVFEIYIFSIKRKRNYQMKQTAGFIAVLLTKFQTPFDLNILENFIKKERKFSPDAVYVHQTRYTKWILEKNTSKPLRFLKNDENLSPIFAIFALADLNCKKAIPLLLEKQHKETNPIIWEVYQEAVQRLEKDFTALHYEERIISLYDTLTPAQRALGAESDNVFVHRAKQKFMVDNTVYETDQD
ncbi:hypothetical protein ACFFLS_13565 [Flavobacterium procerum]|uniref:Uncharacterized protein n=1 Tax=Flavobacterium procerum TaxID=1455569 RepID=A0ABV6BVM4_9FLAO